MSLTITNQWLTSINVKNTFVSQPSDEDILRSARIIVFQLERIQKAFEKVIEDNWLDFDMVFDNFKFIVEGIDHKHNFRDYDSLNTWHSWKDVFNEYMNMLYDLADSRIDVEGHRGVADGIYKFIWIK